MNYKHHWQQFSEEYVDQVRWSYWNTHGAWGPTGRHRIDFANMLLMGGEIAR